MTALVIGATGLVGSHLADQLLDDSRFEKAVAFTRRSLQKQHPKLEERIIDFDNPAEWKHLVKGDVLFSTLGTTLRAAGSKEAQYKIDYTYQYNFAVAAADNGVPSYVLVSAAYSSSNSRIFYSRIKGELERDIKKLSFQHISIIRPGQLSGKRKENRLGEKISISILNLIGKIPGLTLLKPIDANMVARAMVNASLHHPQPVNEYTLGDVFSLAEKNI